MTTSILPPVIMSPVKNPDFHSLITIKSGFFAVLRMTGVEVFGTNIFGVNK